MKKNYFGSDNFAGIHPNILKAIQAVNNGYDLAYGQDPYTSSLVEIFKNIFDKEVDVLLTFGGTGANIVALQSVLQSFNAIICADIAHIHTDECGSIEKFSGSKCLTISTENAKITIDQIKRFLHNQESEHSSQPKVISITQSTEYGTVYDIDEIKKIVEFAHRNNLYVHIDGARIANALVTCDCDLKEMISDTNVDVLSLGGTKNGLLFGEAVIFFNPDLAKHAKFYRKQATQLYSKMKFISAQFIELFKNDLFYKNAANANQMANLLADKLAKIPNIKLTQKVQANSVFCICSDEILKTLKEHFNFYMWNIEKKEIRLMTSFQTKEEEIEELYSVLKRFI